MIRAVLALLLLIAVIAGYSGEARAHAGMAGHGPAVGETVVVDDAAPTGDAVVVPVGADRSSGHLPAGRCCMTAAGCGGVGSIPVAAPQLPVPERVAAAEPAATPDVPDSLDPPVADRPPRPA